MTDNDEKQDKYVLTVGTEVYTTVLNGDTDYELAELAPSCWIGVDNLSVYIRRTDTGVGIEVYAKGEEAEDPIETIYVSSEDAS